MAMTQEKNTMTKSASDRHRGRLVRLRGASMAHRSPRSRGFWRLRSAGVEVFLWGVLFLWSGVASVVEAADRGEAHAATEPERGRGFVQIQPRLEHELAALYPLPAGVVPAPGVLVLTVDRTARAPRYFARLWKLEGDALKPSATAALVLPADLALLGVVRRAGQGSALAMLTVKGLRLWPWNGKQFDASREERLVLSHLFTAAPQTVPVPDWIADLDQDGNDELLIPRVDGVQVVGLDARGAPRELVRLRGAAHADFNQYTRNEYLSLRVPRLRWMQIDGQGPLDVVRYQRGILEVFLLSERASALASSSNASRRPVERRPAARGPRKRQAERRPAERRPAERRQVERRQVERWQAERWQHDFVPPQPFDPQQPWDPPLEVIRLADLNDDGLLDGVFTKTDAGGESLNIESEIWVFYGARDPSGKLTFAKEADQRYQQESFSYPLVADTNRDGREDLILVGASLSLGNIFRALLTRSVSVDVDFYPMAAGKRYPDEPSVEHDLSLRFKRGRFSHKPFAVFADVNGDGLLELLLSEDVDQLGLFWGRPKNFWREDADLTVETPLPVSQRSVLVSDIDADGRSDVLFAFTRHDAREQIETNLRFTLLLSRFAFGERPNPDTAEDEVPVF